MSTWPGRSGADLPNSVPAAIAGIVGPLRTSQGSTPRSAQMGVGADWAPPREPIQRTAQVPPFWQFKPPSGIDLYTQAAGVLAAGAGSQLLLTPVRGWTILPGWKGVLQAFTITVLAPLGTLDITFTLLANGAPVPGWDNFQPDPVAANAIILPFLGPLQLGERVTLSALVTNNAASGPWNVRVAMAGWQWARVEELQTFGSEDS